MLPSRVHAWLLSLSKHARRQYRTHAARDYTGAEIMLVLHDEVRSCMAERPSICVWEFRPVVEMLLDDKGRTAGAIL